MVLALMASKADVNVETYAGAKPGDNCGRSVLGFAAPRGNYGVVRVLHNEGAQPRQHEWEEIMEDDKYKDLRPFLSPPKDQQLLARPAATSTAAAARELDEAEAAKAAEESKALEAAAGESANLQMGSMQLEAAAEDESEDNVWAGLS